MILYNIHGAQVELHGPGDGPSRVGRAGSSIIVKHMFNIYYMCIYLYTHIYMYAHTYIYVYMYIYIYKYVIFLSLSLYIYIHKSLYT